MNMFPHICLPKEVLWEVLSHVFSLHDQFRLAAVSSRFRKYIMTELRKPMCLNIEHDRINDHIIWPDQIPNAIEVLANITQFSEIRIWDNTFIDFDHLLTILMDTNCLNEVSEFETNQIEYSSEILQRFVSCCSNLVKLDLCFYNQHPLKKKKKTDRDMPCPPATLDLTSVLANKSLTHLTLFVLDYTYVQLVELLKSPKPHTLKSLHLRLNSHTFELPFAIDLVRLVNELSGTAWSALEKIQLTCWPIRKQPALLYLCQALIKLPLLTDCTVMIPGWTMPFAEFLLSCAPLFRSSGRPTTAVTYSLSVSYSAIPGCQILDVIHELEKVVPCLQFDFAPLKMAHELIFTLDNISLKVGDPINNGDCPKKDCMQCPSYYPHVFDAFCQASKKRTSIHVDKVQLDRCFLDKFVNDVTSLNAHLPDDVTILSVEIDYSQSFVVVIFETKEGTNQFYVTMHYGHCSNNLCLECL